MNQLAHFCERSHVDLARGELRGSAAIAHFRERVCAEIDQAAHARQLLCFRRPM